MREYILGGAADLFHVKAGLHQFECPLSTVSNFKATADVV